MGGEASGSTSENGGVDHRPDGDHKGQSSERAPVEGDELSTTETVRALEIASSYLDDVEAILWQSANRTVDDSMNEALRHVCEQVWLLQNDLDATIEQGRTTDGDDADKPDSATDAPIETEQNAG